MGLFIKNQDENQQEITFKDPIDLKKYDSLVPYYEEVEKRRSEIAQIQKRAGKRGIISIAIITLCAIAGLVFSVLSKQNSNVPSYLVWVCVGVGFLFLIVSSILNKRIDRPDFKDFINSSYTSINAYVFNDTKYGTATYDPGDKIDLSEVSNDGVFEKIASINSRNVVEGTYCDHSFKVCECGIYKEIKGRQKLTDFVGKLILYSNDLHFTGRYVFVHKSKIETDLPDGINDLYRLYENGDCVLYGQENANYKEDLGTKFISDLFGFELNDHLLNMTISFWAGRTTVYLSYDNNVIMLPFELPYDHSGCEQFKKDLLRLFDIFDESFKD